MNIPEQAIDAVFDALGHEPTTSKEMRRALEAAAPIIAAQALREAANTVITLDGSTTAGWLPADLTSFTHWLDWRADQIEKARTE